MSSEHSSARLSTSCFLLSPARRPLNLQQTLDASALLTALHFSRTQNYIGVTLNPQ